jgi:hypothetical protein
VRLLGYDVGGFEFLDNEFIEGSVVSFEGEFGSYRKAGSLGVVVALIPFGRYFSVFWRDSVLAVSCGDA